MSMGSKRRPKKHPLGPIQAEYHDHKLTWRDLVLFFTPACLAVLAPWAYGTWRSWYGSQYYGPAAAETWGPPWFYLSAVALIALLLLALSRLRRSARWVHLHRDGLHIHTSFGRHIRLNWNQISGIAYRARQRSFLGRVYRTHHDLRIFPTQGKLIRLDPRIHNLDDLTARIKAKRYPRLLHQLRSQYLAGETIAFGSIHLGKKELGLKGRSYAWAQVIQVDLQAGCLMVELQNQPPEAIPAIRIPNIELLLQLIDEGVNA